MLIQKDEVKKEKKGMIPYCCESLFRCISKVNPKELCRKKKYLKMSWNERFWVFVKTLSKFEGSLGETFRDKDDNKES